MHSSLIATAFPTALSTIPGKVGAAVLGTLLLTLSAKLHVPFWPVPMTMQTFAVLTIAVVFGPALGTSTVLLYLVEGALGLPVFSGTPERGVGLAYMTGPTGGYLFGFLVAAFVVARLGVRGWDRGFARAIAAMALGTAIIFAFGVAWLSGLIGFEKAWAVGVQPFLPGAAFKIVLAALALPKLWLLIERNRQ